MRIKLKRLSIALFQAALLFIPIGADAGDAIMLREKDVVPDAASECKEVAKYFNKIGESMVRASKRVLSYGLPTDPKTSLFVIEEHGRRIHDHDSLYKLPGSPFDARFLSCFDAKYFRPEDREEHEETLQSVTECIKNVSCHIDAVEIPRAIEEDLSEMDRSVRAKRRQELEDRIAAIGDSAQTAEELDSFIAQIIFARQAYVKTKEERYHRLSAVIRRAMKRKVSLLNKEVNPPTLHPNREE